MFEIQTELMAIIGTFQIGKHLQGYYNFQNWIQIRLAGKQQGLNSDFH